MDLQQGFVVGVSRSGGVCERDQVMNLYQTNPDLERYSDWSASWKTRRFKDIAAGMGYQVNPRTHWKPLAAKGQWRDEGLL